MATYQAKSSNSLSFEVTKDGTSIGNLSYKSWFKFNAVIELAGNATYQVEPKGFWGTTIELKDGEQVLLKFKMNWKGEIVLQTYFGYIELGYIFKHRGIFKDSFVLTDQDGNELLVMKPNFRWGKMKYEYEATAADTFETLANKEVILLTLVHCANYYMSMMMAAAGA